LIPFLRGHFLIFVVWLFIFKWMDGGVDMESLLNAQNYTCKLYHKLANFKTQYG